MPSLTRRVFTDDFPPFLSLLCSALTLCENDGRRFVGGLSWPGAWPGAWPGVWPGVWPGAWPGVGTLQFHLCPRYALAVAPCLRILQLGSHEGISFLGALDFPEHKALGAGPGLSGRPFAGAGILRYLNVKISSLKVSPFTGLASWLLTLAADSLGLSCSGRRGGSGPIPASLHFGVPAVGSRVGSGPASPGLRKPTPVHAGL